MASTLDELYAERGEWLDSQAHITTQLDKDGYYRDPDQRIAAKIADLTEQIEIVENLQWFAEVDALAKDAADFAATEQSALGTLY